MAQFEAPITANSCCDSCCENRQMMEKEKKDPIASLPVDNPIPYVVCYDTTKQNGMLVILLLNAVKRTRRHTLNCLSNTQTCL